MGTTHFTYPIHIFGASPERIYRALTDRADLDAYLDGTGPMSTWRVGDKVYWKSLPDEDFEDMGQTVLEADPGRILRYTWHPIQDAHRDMFDTDEEFEAARHEWTEVSWEIMEQADPGAGVLLLLTHSGFDGPESKMYTACAAVWPIIASALKTWVESDKAKNR